MHAEVKCKTQKWIVAGFFTSNAAACVNKWEAVVKCRRNRVVTVEVVIFGRSVVSASEGTLLVAWRLIGSLDV